MTPMKTPSLTLVLALVFPFFMLPDLVAEDGFDEPPISYGLSPHSIKLNLTIRAATPGTFEIYFDDDEDKETRVPSFESVVTSVNGDGNPTKEVTTFSYKALKNRRYDNAALLRDLLPGETITGWVLLVINESEGQGGGGYRLVARKNDEEMEIGQINLEPVVSFGTVTTTRNYTYKDDDLIESVKTKGSLRTESLASLDLTAGDSSLRLSGNFRETVEAFSWYPDVSDRSTENVIFPSNRKAAAPALERLVGSFVRDNSSAFIFGSASLGRSRAVPIVEVE